MYKGKNWMIRLWLITACFLLFQNVAVADESGSKRSGVQKNEFPTAFIPKIEGTAAIIEDGQSISLLSSRSTLEEILQKIADDKRVILRFYCIDPGIKQERNPDLRISADSLVNVFQQLLAGDHRFSFLDREGKQTEATKDIATVNIYPKECAGTDPVRVFIPERQHPLQRKPLEEISLEELRNVLKREGPASRGLAVNILGMKGDEKGIPLAKEALKDTNPDVMLKAANALKRLGQKYGSEKVGETIYERFLEKPYAEFLLILAEVNKDKTWAIIDGLMDRSGEREKNIMARALLLTQDRGSIKYLSRIAMGGGTDTSRQAIYAIGKIGGPEAVSVLMNLLRGKESQLQARAAQAVHFLSREDGIEARAEVERIARGEGTSDVFFLALAEVSFLEPLEKLMKDPAAKADLKIRALKAMAAMGKEETIHVMSIGLHDKAPQVRLASVEAMGIIVSEAAIPYLIKASENEDAKVRSAAARALAEFPGDDAVARALGKAINDPDENVRKAAVDAFDDLGKPSEAMIKILRESKNHNDPYVANKVESILNYWGLLCPAVPLRIQRSGREIINIIFSLTTPCTFEYINTYGFSALGDQYLSFS